MKTIPETTRNTIYSFPVFVRIISSITFGIGLALFAKFGSYMRLSGDDYCYGGIFRQFGFWKMQTHSYMVVTPYSGNRYSLTFFSGLAHLFPPQINGWLPGLVITAWLLSLTLIIHQLIRNHSKPIGLFSSFVIAEILLFLTLYMAPDIVQSLYWRSAMLPYTAPLVMNTILLAWMLRGYRSSHIRWPELIGMTMLAIVAGGFSETAGALQFGFYGLLLLTILAIRYRRSMQNINTEIKILAAALFGSSLALALLILSPTNKLRQLYMQLPTSPDLVMLIQSSLHNSLSFAISSITGLITPTAVTVIIGATLSFLIVQGTKQVHLKKLFSASIKKLFFIMLITYILLVCCVAPSAYAQSASPELRAMITGRFIMVIGIFLCGWVAGTLIKNIWSVLRFSPATAQVLATIALLIVSLYPLHAAHKTYTEIPRYRRWATFWDERDQVIVAARNEGIMEIDVVQLDHIIPRVGELADDPGNWYNVCAQGYYDMHAIRAGLPGWDD